MASAMSGRCNTRGLSQPRCAAAAAAAARSRAVLKAHRACRLPARLDPGALPKQRCQAVLHLHPRCEPARATSVSARLQVTAALGSEQELAGSTVVVVGLGASGRAAAKLAYVLGAQVVGVDINAEALPLQEDPLFEGLDTSRVRSELGPHARSTFMQADLLVVSPGVPTKQPDLVAAMSAGVPALSELAFAAQALPVNLPVAAVTGTNGKSTVATFAGQLLNACGVQTFVGGNLGTPLAEAAVALLQGTAKYQAAVVEVSSYQMELPGEFHPKVGVIINLTPDHLERHGSMEAYGRAKCQLFSKMQRRDLAVVDVAARIARARARRWPESELLAQLRAESGTAAAFAELGALPGAVLCADGATQRARLQLPWEARERSVDLGALQAVGVHNFRNAATALLMVTALELDGVDELALEAAVPSLCPPPHRMQLVGESGGVRWINDSKATNVESTAVGVSGIGQAAVVLLGGKAKLDPSGAGLGFGQLAPLLERHRAVLTFGASGDEIAAELEAAGCKCALERCGGMRSAVERARSLATSGECILLSPGCASFDEFNNFEHRGQVFASLAVNDDA